MYQDEKYVLGMPIPHEKSDLQVVALNTESGSEELVSLLDYMEHFEFGVIIISDVTLSRAFSRLTLHRAQNFNTTTVSNQLNVIIYDCFEHSKFSSIHIFGESLGKDEIFISMTKIEIMNDLYCFLKMVNFQLLGVHWTSEYGHLKLYLYAPFWLVNNTGLTLRHMVTPLLRSLLCFFYGLLHYPRLIALC